MRQPFIRAKGRKFRCDHPVSHATLPHAAAESLYRRYPRQTSGRASRAKKAVAIAVRNISGRRRWSKLAEWLGPGSPVSGKLLLPAEAMVAQDFLFNSQVRAWLAGVKSAWTLLTFESLQALRQAPSATRTAIWIANDVSLDEIAVSPIARNVLILFRKVLNMAGGGGIIPRAVTSKSASSEYWSKTARYSWSDWRRRRSVMRKFPAHAGDAGADQRLVADEPEGQADQDRRKGREPRPLCRLPDGRSRHPTANIPGDIAAYCGAAAATPTSASMR